MREAYEAAQFLERNVMQVEMVQDGGSVKRFRGKIEERHEMHDDDKPMKTGGCCGGGCK